MDPVEQIRAATRGTRYENRLFLVGGVVRDKVMGRPHAEDVDIVLEGDAPALARFLHEVGIAERRPVIYSRFGTAMLSVGGKTIELVGARRESYAPESRKPEVATGTLKEDVLRRDFTINTLLENLHTGEVLDLTGRGMADIRDGIIRTPTEPATTFYDDPLRMLRAVRFAVRFNFSIEEGTYRAILADAPRLAIVSRERIRDELAKMLLDDPARGLELLAEMGLLAQFAPELLAMRGVGQGGGHVWDVWSHTLQSLRALPDSADLVLRLAVLFHDVGKPETAEGGHFPGHEVLGAEIARRVLRRLRFPKSESERVARLIELHMRIGEYRREWSDSAVRRLMRDADGDIADLVALAVADRLGANPKASVSDIRELERRMEGLLFPHPAHLESP
ncbi:MAG: CCA tRNA nucleotidyltransferase, partial [Armatimonadota bacterium]